MKETPIATLDGKAFAIVTVVDDKGNKRIALNHSVTDEQVTDSLIMSEADTAEHQVLAELAKVAAENALNVIQKNAANIALEAIGIDNRFGTPTVRTDVGGVQNLINSVVSPRVKGAVTELIESQWD